MFEKILLIDDDEDDREFMLEVLGENFPHVVCNIAVNGQDALDQLKSYRPDVMILDLNMPLMNGRQFLRAVNKNPDLAGIPVVVVSTSSDNYTIEETKGLGAKDFYTKPDKLSGWKAMINSIFKEP
ncbi:response regulator [Flavihumibacter solisilvae]|uniref:Response regulatory domain-containing protein n=1 Tax=Flavihumibacter solisilvae TaxID=1349421 RepID=A0A0C1L6Z0_9BACT|nr:response regulator [Flavihumibacter solisilvae]KIC95912.1 hypothetical protein OI18_03235 [Flavihumibacter solisilvae]